MNVIRATWVPPCAIFFMLCCSLCRGDVSCSWCPQGIPTPNVPGFSTYQVTAYSSDPTDKLIGFDFAGGNGTFGIFGSLHQVTPFGLSTIFADNNLAFLIVGAQVTQDTQFLVTTLDGTVESGTATENATSIKAAFMYSPANIASATNHWTFLQGVVPTGELIRITGTFTVRNQAGVDRLEPFFAEANLCPEPTTGLVWMAGVALVGRRFRRN